MFVFARVFAQGAVELSFAFGVFERAEDFAVVFGWCCEFVPVFCFHLDHAFCAEVDDESDPEEEDECDDAVEDVGGVLEGDCDVHAVES